MSSARRKRRRTLCAPRRGRACRGMRELDRARLQTLVAGFSGKRILVVGDLMLDEFIWGKVSRISPEAPVPVVNIVSESYYPGGGANVARNVREFTASIAMIGLIGADTHGARLLQLLDT